MTYVKHTSCPSCGSRDNLAIYTDHEYCFGCHHVEFYTYHPRRLETTKDTGTPIVSLPEDIQPYIPAVAESWIKKYDLTLRELYDNNVVWSDYRQLLIFPYFDDKHFLWGWQGRYFGTDTKHPKWTGKGNFKEQIKIYLTKNKKSSIIVLTEDIISTIKIQRLYNSSCLHGSYIDINKYSKIYSLYKPKEIVIWLDKDKQKESYLFSLQLNKIGIPSRVVSTDLDPKCYTTSEIKEIIEPKATGITSIL